MPACPLTKSDCICYNICMYRIEFSFGVKDDLKKIRIHDRKIIIDKIEEKLRYEPSRQTKNQKILENLIPPFESIPPIREIKIREYRVFYDIDEEGKKVYVRAVRKKPPHQTTEDIL